MSIQLYCIQTIVAVNTQNILFQKGKAYKGETISPNRFLIKDEFGAKREVNEKNIKGFFKIERDVAP